jgi:leucyl aminopeptidase (aminopeptidase T)
MQIRPYENVLVLTDPATKKIGQALYEAASLVSERVLMLMMPSTRQHGDEPSGAVAELMRKQQIVLAPTRYSLTHTRATRVARNEGARIATMPGITLDVFTEGGMTADFDALKESITEVGARLKRRRSIRVTSEAGTDVEFEVEPRRWKLEDNGICNRPGQVTNLPAGKVFTMPSQGKMNGRIVIDGSWDSNLLEEPLTLHIEEGLVKKVEGGEMAELVRESYEEAALRLKPKDQGAVWTVAEFGFGMNPKARLTGNVLEDEKVLGTCYFAIGDNSTLGGSAHVGIQVTGVLREPTVHLDEMLLLDGGDLAD